MYAGSVAQYSHNSSQTSYALTVLERTFPLSVSAPKNEQARSDTRRV